MSIINNYVIDAGGGPLFEKPHTAGKPYAKNVDRMAASVDGARDIVDTVLGNVGSLAQDISSLKRSINALMDKWNNFIIIEGQAKKYLDENDMNIELNNLEETCETGKDKCDRVLNEYSETINEINAYLAELKENYGNYLDLVRREADYTAKRDANPLDYSKYQSLINEVVKAKNEYVEVKDISSCGKWVEN